MEQKQQNASDTHYALSDEGIDNYITYAINNFKCSKIDTDNCFKEITVSKDNDYNIDNAQLLENAMNIKIIQATAPATATAPAATEPPAPAEIINYQKVINGETNDDEKKKNWIGRLYIFGYVMKAIVNKLNEKSYGLEYLEFRNNGSETPSSDIDIGIQYNKEASKLGDKKKLPNISEFIYAFETYFLDFKDFNCTCLDFDIEMYGVYEVMYDNKLHIPVVKEVNEMNGTNNKLPQATINESNELTTSFNACLIYVLAGIIKNVVQGEISIDTCIRRIKNLTHEESNECIKKLEDVNTNTLKFEITTDVKPGTNVSYKSYNHVLGKYFTEENFNKAKEHAKTFFAKTYQETIEKYKEKLDQIHNILYRDETEVSHTLLAKTMCEANLYRTEGYISPFTVYSIVYIHQSKTNSDDNRKSSFITGNIGTETLCYLEQLGFLLRYFNTDKKKVDQKKVDKYTYRLEKYNIVTIAILNEPGIVGGKRRKAIHRRSKKKKRSKTRTSRQKRNKSKRRYRNRKQS